MTTMTETRTTQVYQVFIRATPERIWEAITSAEFTSKYFYGTYVESTLVPGSPYVSYSADRRLVTDGEVIEADRPRKLVHTWRSLWNDELAAEQPSRVTWEIEADDGGVCKVTVVHDQLDGAPKTAQEVQGEGWMRVLSGLKTLLETGKPLSS
jgi:uncharacterized protein YndB with AHSA1/START domain